MSGLHHLAMSGWRTTRAPLMALPAILLLLALCALGGCPKGSGGSGGGGIQLPGKKIGGSLSILSGSENKSLEPIIQRFAQQQGAEIKLDYKGSVDIMLEVEKGDQIEADAVWPANGMWATLGDKAKLLKHEQSIFRSPVVMAVKKGVAQRLGWVGKDVMVADILAAAEAGELRYMMTSATQSNSGASAYFGYLYAFAGNPEVLAQADLDKPELRKQIKRILGTVNRSSGSSGWLAELFVDKYENFDAMVNYESVVIETNQKLQSEGKEPLYCIYPQDGLAIADSPLLYVNKSDYKKEALFNALQEYLLSQPVQDEIFRSGRRTGPLGMNPENTDTAVFNPDWGIDLARTISPIRFPEEAVIRQALVLYQTAFRKPSFTIYCLDYSGSMAGEGEAQLKEAMSTLLEPDSAARYLLQTSPGDVTVVIPFDDRVIDVWRVEGNDPAKLRELQRQIETVEGGGGTNIYLPVMQALDVLSQEDQLRDYFPAVILMTDGQSNQGSFEELERYWRGKRINADIPTFSIMFGDASADQLKQISEYSSGRDFDGRKDLVEAFRTAKGYN